MGEARESRIGPWLVASGAALWGTENAWRTPLSKRLDVDVLVFWEHVILVALALPFVIPRLPELRRASRRALGSLVFSGVAGSALGAVLYTLAIKHGNQSVVSVVLNIQPVLSTSAAVLLFGDRLAKNFPPWAGLAVVAGMVLVGLGPQLTFSVDAGIGYALACALCWGLSTVAGRAVMVEMSLPLAAGLRVIIGLISMTILVGARGLLTPEGLWPAAAHAEAGLTVLLLILLATVSGAVPLVIYFKGLSLTRASTAGYFEMMQTIAAVSISWGAFHEALAWWQVIAAAVLMFAVAMVQRAQEATALSRPPADVPARAVG
jgi:drug/metabolite transporter (DMT)-like permease